MKLLLALGAVASAGVLHASPAPSRVQVVAHEYSFGLSRLHVKAGTAVIQLANFGQDPHDLRVQQIGARHVAGLRDVTPGARGELTLRLAPGRYSFWCSIANHRRLGMRAVLTVTR